MKHEEAERVTLKGDLLRFFVDCILAELGLGVPELGLGVPGRGLVFPVGARCSGPVFDAAFIGSSGRVAPGRGLA